MNENVDTGALCPFTLRVVIDRLREIKAPWCARIIELDTKHKQLGPEVDEERAQHVQGIRMLADVLANHPEIESPIKGGVSMTFWSWSVDDPKAEMLKYRRAYGGKWEKDAAHYFSLKGKLAGLPVTLSTERDAVCEKVVVGTETKKVTKYGPSYTVDEEVDIVEWRCPEGLLA